MNQIPTIETKRLILREVDPDCDFEPWAEMMADEETMRFIGGKTLNRAQAWRSMATCIGHQQIRGFSFFSVIEKATGEWVGRIGPWYPEDWVGREVGWTIHPGYRQRGFAKEAGAACVQYAFETLKWERVIHVIAEENIASQKTAEAIGSDRLYMLDGIPDVTDLKCWVYGQENTQAG